MVCIYCGGPTNVTNSRPQKKLNQVWRRRSCLNCSGLFTTTETPLNSTVLMVKTDSGKLIPLSRDKLFLSIYESCRHRKTAVNDATALVDTVLTKLFGTNHRGVLTSSAIRDITHKTLQHFDQAAGTHYRAYFMQLKEV